MQFFWESSPYSTAGWPANGSSVGGLGSSRNRSSAARTCCSPAWRSSFLYCQWRPLPDVIWSVESGGGQAVARTLFAIGWLTVLLATLMIHHLDLLGMRQIWLRFQNLPYRDLGFRTPGLCRYVRHPIQVGLLIAFWATPTMTVGHLIFALGTTAYIVIAVKTFEERDLLKEFGPLYENYREQVGGFLPKGRYREASPSR